MLKMSDYVWECFCIGDNNNVDVDDARIMFFCNVRDEAPTYRGSDDVNYATIASEFKSMSKDAQAEERMLLSKIISTKYHELCEAYTTGNKELFLQIANSYVPTLDNDEDGSTAYEYFEDFDTEHVG